MVNGIFAAQIEYVRDSNIHTEGDKEREMGKRKGEKWSADLCVEYKHIRVVN